MKIVKQFKYLNYNIFEYDIVDSTMIIIKNFPENTIVIAKQQNNGRGKGDRVWNSEDNGNLYFSLNIKADKKDIDYSQLSFLSSLAMRYAIEKFNNSQNKIVSKWPNDILIDKKKVAGILLQFDILKKNLVVGIGVNINKYPEDVLFNASSLKDCGIITDKYHILEEFLNSFNNLLNSWQTIGFSIIRENWLKSCYKLNEKIKINDTEGIFKDIDKDGSLALEKPNKEIILIKSGDVF